MGITDLVCVQNWTTHAYTEGKLDILMPIFLIYIKFHLIIYTNLSWDFVNYRIRSRSWFRIYDHDYRFPEIIILQIVKNHFCLESIKEKKKLGAFLKKKYNKGLAF